MFFANKKKTLKECVNTFLENEFINKSGLGGINYIEKNIISTIADNMFSDLRSLVGNKVVDNVIHIYKWREFNGTFVSKFYKIKVYTGLNKSFARKNYEIMQRHFRNQINRLEPKVIDKDDYRIEVYKYVRGMTISELSFKFKPEGYETEIYNKYYKEHIIDFNDLINCFLNYTLETYYRTRDKDNNVYFCNDNNISNFVLTPQFSVAENKTSEMINIDFDFISYDNYHIMIHNTSWQFLSHIFDEQYYSEEKVTDLISEFRDKHSLLDLVEEFKRNFYFKIGEEYLLSDGILDCFYVDESIGDQRSPVDGIIKEYNDRIKDGLTERRNKCNV